MPSKLSVLGLALGLAVVGCTGDTGGGAARGLGSGPDAGHAVTAAAPVDFDKCA